MIDNTHVTLLDIILAAPILLMSTAFWVFVVIIAGAVFSLITAAVKLLSNGDE